MRTQKNAISIQFFINIDKIGNIGNSLIAVAYKHKKQDQAKDFLKKNALLVFDYCEKKGTFSGEVIFSDTDKVYFDENIIRKRDIAFFSYPLREDFALLEEYKQQEIVNNIKMATIGTLIYQTNPLPPTDINRLTVILEEYSIIESVEGERLFSKISGVGQIEVFE